MKEELVKLWEEYKSIVIDKDRATANRIIDQFGGQMLSREPYYTPSFEGFMEWLSTESLKSTL